MTRKSLILFGVVFVLGLLLGGWGMYEIQGRARQKAVDTATQSARDECASIQKERDELARHAKMTELRLRLGLVAIQAGRMNYGNARTEAESLFADAAALETVMRGTPDARELNAILSRKEQILADLAVGSPTATEALEQLYAASPESARKR